MWAVIFGLLLIGQAYALINHLNRKKDLSDEPKGYNLQDPAIDIEPVYNSKKNN
jgi:hypothetical protein